MLKTWQLWTDGSANLHVNAGYGFVFVYNDVIQYQQNGKITEPPFTCSHAEIVALVEGVTIYSKSPISTEELLIFCDSEFVVKTINEWGPKRTPDEWKRKEYHHLLEPLVKWFQVNTQVKIRHVKAHSGIKYNAFVDKLAKKAALTHI
jgi:ribonuclease HI